MAFPLTKTKKLKKIALPRPQTSFGKRIKVRLDTIRFHTAVRLAGLPKIPKPPRLLAAAICFVGLFAVPMAAALQPCLKVTLNGQTIGYVNDASSVQLAANLLETSMESQFGVTYSFDDELSYQSALMLKGKTSSVDDMVSSLAEASDDLERMAVLTVNGETVGACRSLEDVQDMLDSLLDVYKSNDSDHARFVENVNVTLSPAPADAEVSAEDLKQQITEEGLLDVEVYSTQTYTEPIPYSTQMVENDQLAQYSTKTMQVGQDGEASVQEQVVTLNGVETQRTVVSRAILTQATDAVVAVGTGGSDIGTGTLIAPVTEYRFTSAFKFRNGRWHKGVDLAVSEGTLVYAADNGKVIVSEWSDSYGNYIIIDHQNGLKTLYAHNSTLLVNVGDTVTKGRQIALSGNTGNSTGPHVHFEVHYNGVAVNPELYVSFGTETP